MTLFSPLPGQPDDGENPQRFKGVSRIVGPSWAHLPTVTIGLLGVQIFWSVEMSYASPYLLSLGLSKSSMAIVFVAGPLSGLIMQPLIGVLADNCTSSFGRRRPYMMLGTSICVLAMLLLGFTRAVASVFTGWDNDANDSLTILLAVLSIYLIDFSINAVQAVDRALLVDTLPPSEQATGNAWAARMLGIGSVVGFFVGNINLPNLLPFLGKSQLQVLSVVVSILLFAGHLMMSILVKERILLRELPTSSNRKSFFDEMRDIWSNILTLPRIIRQICFVQFFAWIAWFPVLFYSTIYVGDLYKRSVPAASSDEAQKLLDAEAIRLGSRALFYSSILALAANLILPAFVPEAAAHSQAPERSKQRDPFWKRLPEIPKAMQIHLATLWAASHLIFAGCMFATFFTSSVWGSTTLITITGFSWAITQWAPFSLLAEAILTEPAPQAADDDTGAIRLADTRTRPRTRVADEREAFLSEGIKAGDDDDSEDEGTTALQEERRQVLGSSGAQLSRIDLRVNSVDVEDDYEFISNRSRDGQRRPRPRNPPVGSSLSAKAGIILGIHNIFIVIPQFLVTGLSAILFALFDPKKSVVPGHHSPPNSPLPGHIGNHTLLASNGTTEELFTRISGPLLAPRAEIEADVSNSVVYIFRIGGVAAAFAFVLCWRLARELRHR